MLDAAPASALSRSDRPTRSGRRAARWRHLAAAGLLPVLVLAACSEDGSSTATTVDPSANTMSLDDVEISDDMGEAPTVSFDPAFALAESANRTVVEGDGETIDEGDWVSVNYVVISGDDGTELSSTWGATPETLPINDTLQDEFREVLVGSTLGSRAAVATEAEGQWVVLVLDLEELVPREASGTEVTPAEGLPTVTVEDGVPTITMPGGDPPGELVVQPLIEGDGPEVAPGQTITAQYVGAIWASGEVFDSSWARSEPIATVIGEGQVIAGWDEGLVGQPVGSRVLLVIPPEQGYGSEGNPDAGISGTDTLAFVVDVLAAG